MESKVMTSEIVIKPKKGWVDIGLKELWLYRELIYFFAWREIKIRYKQTVLGALWAVLQPLIATVIFTVFFGRLAKIPSDGIPYPVFVYIGLILWNYFSFGITHSSSSMIENADVVQKIYFPRLIIPLSSCLVGLVDFFISCLILVGLMLVYGYIPQLKGIIFMPFLIVITFLSSMGIGAFLSAVNVKYRDVRYIIPFFIQLAMFVAPVIYPASIVGERFRWILALNPMTGVIETSRSLILGSGIINLQLLLLSCLTCIGLFILGVSYFKQTERFFADII
ncbi:ABC transporter permease [Candidatus Omnitrophota bacterium]